jgi:hypothetical protein
MVRASAFTKIPSHANVFSCGDVDRLLSLDEGHQTPAARRKRPHTRESELQLRQRRVHPDSDWHFTIIANFSKAGRDNYCIGAPEL